MKPNIKAAFFDLDGTLLSHTLKRIPESAKLAIRKLQENGIKVYLSTGRHLSELKELPVMDVDFDGFVLLNGQIVLDRNYKMIYGNRFDSKTIEFLVDLFNKKENPIFLVDEEGMYINYVSEYAEYVQRKVSTPLPQVKEYDGKDLYMAVAFLKKEEEPTVFKDLPNTVEPTRWNEDGVDIISRGDGKAEGIKKVIEFLNITKDEIISFGDGENDISMLDYAGLGIAMGNSMEEVKKHADYITDHIDNDGVYKALKHFDII